jgi:hypothetical protein
MIVKSPNQVSPSGWLKWFPVPRNFNVEAKSRIGTGREWPAPPNAKRTKPFQGACLKSQDFISRFVTSVGIRSTVGPLQDVQFTLPDLTVPAA